jgi:hypothetical protein
MAEMIGVQPPSAEGLRRLAGAIGGFSQEAIDQGCKAIEDAPQPEFRRMPTLNELEGACRNAAQAKRERPQFCNICENGWVTERRNVPAYRNLPGGESTSYVRRCPNGCVPGAA